MYSLLNTYKSSLKTKFSLMVDSLCKKSATIARKKLKCMNYLGSLYVYYPCVYIEFQENMKRHEFNIIKLIWESFFFFFSPFNVKLCHCFPGTIFGKTSSARGLTSDGNCLLGLCVFLSHYTWLHVLVDALVVVVRLRVVRSSGAGMEGRDSVKVQNELLPVTHGSSWVAGIPRQSHCKQTGHKMSACLHLSCSWAVFNINTWYLNFTIHPFC